uniref:Putative secreted protein n=1 Tax=Ixodes ricinus TaxID=34613 RepID=A0A6B0UHP5_IXORI
MWRDHRTLLTLWLCPESVWKTFAYFVSTTTICLWHPYASKDWNPHSMASLLAGARAPGRILEEIFLITGFTVPSSLRFSEESRASGDIPPSVAPTIEAYDGRK